MRKHQVREGESLYASTPTILHGLSTDYDITFHQIGTFEERKDALKILEAWSGPHSARRPLSTRIGRVMEKIEVGATQSSLSGISPILTG
jgi:hypothetical protein